MYCLDHQRRNGRHGLSRVTTTSHRKSQIDGLIKRREVNRRRWVHDSTRKRNVSLTNGNGNAISDDFVKQYWVAPRRPPARLRRDRNNIATPLQSLRKSVDINGRTHGADIQYALSEVSKVHGFLIDKDIRALMDATGYNRRELFALFARFKALCTLACQKNGSCEGIDKETFRKGILMLSVEDDMFVDRVFTVLDEDGSGTIEWDEFINAMSALERGTNESKANFLFSVYDQDKDGGISKDELLQFFLSSLMVTVDDMVMEVSEYFVSRVFDEVDKDANGKINLDEALRYIARHPECRDIYQMFGRTLT